MTLTATKPTTRPATAFDPHKVRADFPILSTKVHGKPLVYLDNGATTQKPRQVIDAVKHYYEKQNANIHRGVYYLSQLATDAYEEARRKVAAFINAPDEKCVLFTRGTTEGINLVAASFGRRHLSAGDEVIVSGMEHHSNIVPWQIACEAAGAKLRVIPITDYGELDLDEYRKLLSARTKIVAVTHLSNALGTINDVKRIAEMAHGVGAKVLVDGAQWVAHHRTDVQDLGCDFYAFSGHKLFGPTGIGILWGRRELLEQMPPYQGGGDMIESVTFEKTTYAALPNKFEAGTPDIAGAIGLGAAVDYVNSVGIDAFGRYEEELLAYATEQLSKVPGLRILGPTGRKGTVISFVVHDPPVSSLDVGTRLDAEGIAIRTGHHCCMPLMARLGVPATARASLAMYNTREDVDALVKGLRKLREEFAGKAARKKAAVSDDGASEAPSSFEVKYPQPAAESPTAAADELADDFEVLGDRDDRNQYILELGEKLPPMPDVLKNEQTRVHGCMSTVHLYGRRRPGTADTLDFVADSDAHIVRGLIAILEKLFSGQSAGEVLKFDVEDFFRRIDLDQFISSQRRNGLAGMVKRIRAVATQISRQPPA
jgi:cysteine desulfurase/selenocysteine lyase